MQQDLHCLLSITECRVQNPHHTSALTILGNIEMPERSHDQYGGQKIWDVVHVTWRGETPTGQVGRSECAAVPSLCQAGAAMQCWGSNIIRRVLLKTVLTLSSKYLWYSTQQPIRESLKKVLRLFCSLEL